MPEMPEKNNQKIVIRAQKAIQKSQYNIYCIFHKFCYTNNSEYLIRGCILLKTFKHSKKILLLITFVLSLIFVCSAFAVTGTGETKSNTDSSSIISSETDMSVSRIPESTCSSINEVKNSSASERQSSEFVNNQSDVQVSSQYNSSSDVQTSSYYDNTSDVTTSSIGCNGFIWMSIDRMRSEIDTLELNRFYDEIESDTGSVPMYDFDIDVFFNIIKTIKKYNWIDHREYINAYQIKACQLTVIGSNTVYTYLTFGRDESGRYFVWSFYDYKIAYLSEQDYRYIQDIFSDIA